MTGYASAEAAAGTHSVAWELRSVNHRYLDISFRLPEELRALEPHCKEAIGSLLRRGKIDAILKLTKSTQDVPPTEVNEEALAALMNLEQHVRERAADARPLTISEILRWPGVLAESSALPDDLDRVALECLGSAIRALKDARDREGARLADTLLERCAGISRIVGLIKPQLADVAERYRSKLLERLERFDLELDPERLEQEVALLAQRLDVAEELDRLESHVLEIEATLKKDEAIGRRLDFIIQELNREANTFASKIQDEELARAGIELKVLIEQMREQVQNLE